MTRDPSDEQQATSDAVLAHILIAFLIPTWPVQQLALPELTTTAEMFRLFICSLLTCTAADVILLVVKTAAAFAPAGQTSSAKSALPDFLIPQLTPAAKKPLGTVIVLFAIYKIPELFNELIHQNTVSITILSKFNLFYLFTFFDKA
ncbi:hypothetical protein ES703_119254 [subsurface metagenome]